VPALERLTAPLDSKSRAFDGLVKFARTHLQDSTQLPLAQEF